MLKHPIHNHFTFEWGGFPQSYTRSRGDNYLTSSYGASSNKMLKTAKMSQSQDIFSVGSLDSQVVLDSYMCLARICTMGFADGTFMG